MKTILVAIFAFSLSLTLAAQSPTPTSTVASVTASAATPASSTKPASAATPASTSAPAPAKPADLATTLTDAETAVTATNTDLKGLYAELDLTITEEGTDCSTFDGDVLYGPAPFLLSGNLIGDPAQGEDTGDRTLAASANEVLCFKVDLPSGAPNSVQGATTTAVFTFEAEQTSSNP